MWKEFKEFCFKGNLVELAVAFILAVAFAAVVKSVVEDLVTPLIAAVAGEPDFGRLTLTVGDGVVRYGNFLNVVLNFLLVAFALFLIVKAFTAAQRRRDVPAEPGVKTCSFCLESVPAGATRCKYCTSELSAA